MKPWAIRKVLLICFAERGEACQHPPYLKPCWWQEDEDAVSQACSAKQRSPAAEAEATHFHGPGDKTPCAVLSAPSRKERSRCCSYRNQRGLLLSDVTDRWLQKVPLKHPQGGGGGMCSLIWAINHNFVWQENVQKMICYSKGLCPFLCSYYSSSRQMGRVRAAAGVINLYHCIDLSSCPWRKDDWDFLERGQGSGLRTGRAV